MVDPKTITDLLLGRSQGDLARVVAYLVAPTLVMFLAGAGVYTPGLGVDFSKPVSVVELMTEITADGQVAARRGIALMVEPSDLEYEIPVTGATSMWTSIREDIIHANSRRLVLTEHGLSGKSPLIGVGEPVTVIIQGVPGNSILIPGKTEDLDDWRLQSRRSVALVSSVLLSCVFAFGMAVATGLPSRETREDGRRKKRTEPHKE